MLQTELDREYSVIEFLRTTGDIDRKSPNKKTEPDLTEAYEVLHDSRSPFNEQSDALFNLTQQYNRLQVANLLDGSHSFIRFTLETLTFDDNHPLSEQAARVIGVLARHRTEREMAIWNLDDPSHPFTERAIDHFFNSRNIIDMGKRFERWEVDTQDNSDFDLRLQKSFPLRKTEDVLVTYATARHSVKYSDHAGNLLLLSSKGFIPNTPFLVKLISGYLSAKLYSHEFDSYRKSQMRNLDEIRYSDNDKDNTARVERRDHFRQFFGIDVEEIETAEQLAHIVIASSHPILWHGFIDYIESLPRITDNKAHDVITSFWHRNSDELHVDRIAREFSDRLYPISPCQSFIVPRQYK